MSILPRVLIVGRTNVGKSTLFNRLSTDVKSLAFDYEGVTRDFLKDTVCWQGRCFELIDTGGISVRRSQDPIIEETRKRALSLFEDADIILFVCDGKVGVLPEDRALAKMLHKMGKRVLLAVNKSDAQVAQEQMHEFERLGFTDLFPISAQHGIGIADLLESIVTALPYEKKEQEEAKLTCKVVLLGKPNVGKSSLLNLLLKEERAIVADMPGTTREAISERVRFFKEDILVTDTAGVRRKRAVHEPLENLMVKSSLKALEEANVVLLLIDASSGQLSDQELKLAFYAFEERYKALILLFNKQDLMQEYESEMLAMATDEYKYFIKKLATLNISCKTGANIGKVLPLVQKVWERYSQNLPIEDLTLFFKDALHKKPLYRNEQLLHVYKAKQIKTAPITILLYVNVPGWFEASQLAYFENLLRREYDLQGVPIKFIVRKR